MKSPSRPKTRWAMDRQQLVIVLAAAVMVASYLLLVLWPKQRELSILGAAVEQQRGLLGQKVLASSEGMYVSARLPGLRRVQATLTERLPAEADVTGYFQAVAECAAAEPSVTHEVQRSIAQPNKEPAPAVPVRLRLAGPFDAVYRCLGQIEGIGRMSRLARLRMTCGSEPGHVEAEAEILIYYLPTGAAAPTPATAAVNVRDRATQPASEPQGING